MKRCGVAMVQTRRNGGEVEVLDGLLFSPILAAIFIFIYPSIPAPICLFPSFYAATPVLATVGGCVSRIVRRCIFSLILLEGGDQLQLDPVVIY